jgi:hypothetical protein
VVPYLAAMSYSVSPDSTIWMNGVAVAGGVGVNVPVGVAVGLGKMVGVLVAVGVVLDVAVAALVGVGERVCVGVQVGVGVGLGVRVAVGIRVGQGVVDGAGGEVSTSAGVAVTSLVVRSVATVAGCWVLACRCSQIATTRTNATPIRIERIINAGRIQ